MSGESKDPYNSKPVEYQFSKPAFVTYSIDVLQEQCIITSNQIDLLFGKTLI